jgi:DNA-binding PadR family transcriptional regulator
LLPIELSTLAAGLDLMRQGQPEFHGYAVAREMRDRDEARRLTAHGTLYRALERLESAGLLRSRLEDADIAAAETRPRRRLYALTAEGQRAASAATAQITQATATRPRLAAP